MAHRLTDRSWKASRPDAKKGDETDESALNRRRFVQLGAASVGGFGLASRAEAAKAGDGSTPPTNEEGTLTLIGTGAPTNYEITVQGSILAEESGSAGDVHISGSSSEGVVTNGMKKYHFTGSVSEILTDGNIDIQLNCD